MTRIRGESEGSSRDEQHEGINGAWAEYLLVPDARANLAPIPDDLAEDVVLCSDFRQAAVKPCAFHRALNASAGAAVLVWELPR